MVGSQMVGTVWKESRMWACGLGWAGFFWQGHVFQWVHHLLGSIFVKTHGIHPIELSTEEGGLWSLASMIRINLIPVQGSIGDGLWIGGTGYLQSTCFIRCPKENFTHNVNENVRTTCVHFTDILKKILSTMCHSSWTTNCSDYPKSLIFDSWWHLIHDLSKKKDGWCKTNI